MSVKRLNILLVDDDAVDVMNVQSPAFVELMAALNAYWTRVEMP